tara:strand:- start:764 stop:931 length:168 start_codon:yes stop_codon:yes gene_type:complete
MSIEILDADALEYDALETSDTLNRCRTSVLFMPIPVIQWNENESEQFKYFEENNE